jgi:hypothetical protein
MKPRSDSKLKTLPEDRQAQIVAWSKEPKTDEHPGGLAYAQEQLAADGIRVALSTLSEFCSWYALNQRFARASSRADQVADLLRQQNPNMDPEQVRRLAQSVFTMEALDAGDAETFVSLEHLKLAQDSARTKAEIDREKLAIAKQRLLLDRARQQLQRIAENGLTDENKDGVSALLSELEALGVK